ncbi:Protein fem-1 C [Clonorchis sinensis]|uniref:Protein fem-1 C n=1 Tax=Clonorchis sinensis TaxID=79923 RepID=A0A8T1LX71_CLOSI|nr:Protein fem-1 C [Clonorchis sinensis]
MANVTPVHVNCSIDQNILNYCTSGDLDSLKSYAPILDQVIHNNFPGGQTCLIAACRNGHRDVAEYLIDVCGADVEQVGVVEFESEQVEGVPPLWCAAAAGHLAVVELLVSRGADVNRTTITNSTALRAACFDGHEQVVRFLVDHGANVEIPNRHGHTCLMISCYRRHDRIVEFLLSKKARVNRRSAKGNTALHDCAESGNLKGLQFLLEHRAIMRKDEYGQSPIMSGANAAFKKIVDYLSELSDASSPTDSSAISIHEKIAAYELLGASLFDRHSLVQDAIAAWFEALKLRREAGTYPKSFIPFQPQCECSDQEIQPDSSGCSDHPQQNYLDSRQRLQRKSAADVFGANWSLVNLAAREAIAVNYTSQWDSHESGEPYVDGDILCSSCRCSALLSSSTLSPTGDAGPNTETTDPVCNLYRLKQRELQSQLYAEYLKEIGRPVFPHCSDDLVDAPVARPDGLLSAKKTTLSSPGTHMVIGLVHPATPADPIRKIEPSCWDCPRYRHWPLGRPSGSQWRHGWSNSSKRGDQRRNPIRNRCEVCKMEIIKLDSIRQNCSSSISICTPCSINPQKVAVASSTFSARTRTSTYKPDHSPLPSLQHSKWICSCCHLALETHPMIGRLRQCGEEAFGHVREFVNSEELSDLMRNAHSLRLQPLLIRLRILGPDHPDTIYFIRYRGAIYADADNFRQCLNLWRYALELQRIFLEPLCHVSQAAFVSFAELFQFVLTNNYTGLPAVDLDPVLIVDCLELAVDNIERGMDYSFYRWHQRYPWSYTTADKEAVNLMRHVALCLHFIAMILTHYLPEPGALPLVSPLRRASNGWEELVGPPAVPRPPTPQPSRMRMSDALFDAVVDSNSSPETSPSRDAIARRMHSAVGDELKSRFLYQAYRLVRLDPRVHHGHSLLHLASSPETSTVGRFIICHFPNVAVLNLLFQLGADLNCVDVDGQRPLMCVLSHRRLQTEEQASLVALLIRNGAHLDATNKDGVSALDSQFRHVLVKSGLCILDHITLACQAARVARRSGFNARNASCFNLPDNLWSFIEMH